MKKLGARNYLLISRGVKTEGSYDPDQILYLFEEELYTHEIKEIIEFLKWVHVNGKMFGSGNYEVIFAEWKSFLKENFKPGKEGKLEQRPNTLIKREIPK